VLWSTTNLSDPSAWQVVDGAIDRTPPTNGWSGAGADATSPVYYRVSVTNDR
jgi:hypothetical protein